MDWVGVEVGTVVAGVVETGYREAKVEEVAEAWVVETMYGVAEVEEVVVAVILLSISLSVSFG